jgi:hypothetical protein
MRNALFTRRYWSSATPETLSGVSGQGEPATYGGHVRRFFVIATMVAATLMYAPPALGTGQKTDPLKLVYDTSKVVAGETLHLTGVLHVHVVHNADGRTLHVNLSQGQAISQTTGDRYRVIGAQEVPIPADCDNVLANFTAHILAPGKSASHQTVHRPVVATILLEFDETGGLDSARVVSAPSHVNIEVPTEGQVVRGTVEVRAVVDLDCPGYVVRFERSIAGGDWSQIASDSSSPYTVLDSLPADLPPGTPIQYRAILSAPDGTTVTSAIRTVRAGGPPLRHASVYYYRPAQDYSDWGLHLWGAAVAVETEWHAPFPWTRIEDGWAVYVIPLRDDTKQVNFVIHLPSGDSVPDSREPGFEQSFIPLQNPAVWMIQGDATVYTSKPAL